MQSDLGGTAWVHNLYDHDPSECTDSTNWGVSPWMTGLLLEPFIDYHRLTGSNVARQSILWALEYLKDKRSGDVRFVHWRVVHLHARLQ